MRAPRQNLLAETERPVRRRIATDDVELLDLLDRILDKGLFLGSANLLVLGQTNLSQPDMRISVACLQTNSDSFTSPPRGPSLVRSKR
jgi:hypothetical protein